MKQGKRRTMSICLTDIDKTKILVHENGKKYLSIETWDYDEPDKYDNDFSVSMCLSKEEIEKKKTGEDIKRVFIGSGRIWEQLESTRPITQEEIDKDDDLPF